MTLAVGNWFSLMHAQMRRAEDELESGGGYNRLTEFFDNREEVKAFGITLVYNILSVIVHSVL